jgi:GNAT superfamily N-acetyltransferase
MRKEDISFAIRLSDQEHWGTTRGDYDRLMALTPAGCFTAYEGNQMVGLTTATMYGRTVAWIGNVIVHREYRGKHIGQALVKHALNFLKKERVHNIALYCFNEHVQFYQNLGFVRDTQFVRLHRKARSNTAFAASTLSRLPTLKELLRADERAFGADRSRLLLDVLRRKEGWFVGAAESKNRLSYLLVREYAGMCELGPWVSHNPAKNEPERTLRLALHNVGRRPVEASSLRKNRSSLRLLRRNGFEVMREGYRMLCGRRASLGDDRAQFALGFQDKG